MHGDRANGNFDRLPETKKNDSSPADSGVAIFLKGTLLSKALTCIYKNGYFIKKTDTFDYIVV